MLSKKMEDALNAQINMEFWSSHLYLSMAAYLAKDGKMGFSNWFRVQALEENDHAMKLFDYIIARDGEVKLQSVKEVPQAWTSPTAIFEAALKHEEVVTKRFDLLMEIAHVEKDFAAVSALQWFVDEQIEEETQTREYIGSLKMIGDDGLGLYTLDKELKTRVYTPLSATSPV